MKYIILFIASIFIFAACSDNQAFMARKVVDNPYSIFSNGNDSGDDAAEEEINGELTTTEERNPGNYGTNSPQEDTSQLEKPTIEVRPYITALDLINFTLNRQALLPSSRLRDTEIGQSEQEELRCYNLVQASISGFTNALIEWLKGSQSDYRKVIRGTRTYYLFTEIDNIDNYQVREIINFDENDITNGALCYIVP